MKHAIAFVFTFAATLLAFSGAAPAAAQNIQHNMQQEMKHDNPSENAKPAADTSGSVPLVSGEIRKVDTEAGKITIRHAEIPNLEMPPMTMVFRAATPDLLGKAKAGDQVLFSAEKSHGVLTVTSLQAVTKK